MDGYPLMQTVFSAKTPKLVMQTPQRIQAKMFNVDLWICLPEQRRLAKPKAHENDFITAENAARQLMFASMLMYELDEALEREENSTIAAVEKVQLVADTDFASNGHRGG